MFLACPAGGGAKGKNIYNEAKMGWRQLLKKSLYNKWLTIYENIRNDFSSSADASADKIN